MGRKRIVSFNIYKTKRLTFHQNRSESEISPFTMNGSTLNHAPGYSNSRKTSSGKDDGKNDRLFVPFQEAPVSFCHVLSSQDSDKRSIDAMSAQSKSFQNSELVTKSSRGDLFSTLCNVTSLSLLYTLFPRQMFRWALSVQTFTARTRHDTSTRSNHLHLPRIQFIKRKFH